MNRMTNYFYHGIAPGRNESCFSIGDLWLHFVSGYLIGVGNYISESCWVLSKKAISETTSNPEKIQKMLDEAHEIAHEYTEGVEENRTLYDNALDLQEKTFQLVIEQVNKELDIRVTGGG